MQEREIEGERERGGGGGGGGGGEGRIGEDRELSGVEPRMLPRVTHACCLGIQHLVRLSCVRTGIIRRCDAALLTSCISVNGMYGIHDV